MGGKLLDKRYERVCPAVQLDLKGARDRTPVGSWVSRGPSYSSKVVNQISISSLRRPTARARRVAIDGRSSSWTDVGMTTNSVYTDERQAEWAPDRKVESPPMSVATRPFFRGTVQD
jgi:hypothetical protein